MGKPFCSITRYSSERLGRTTLHTDSQLQFQDSVSNVEREVYSNTAMFSGGVSVPASISHGEYSIDGGPFSPEFRMVPPNSTIQLKAFAPKEPNSEVTVQLTLGSAVSTWIITT